MAKRNRDITQGFGLWMAGIALLAGACTVGDALDGGTDDCLGHIVLGCSGLKLDVGLDGVEVLVGPDRTNVRVVDLILVRAKTTIAHGYLTLSLLPYLWGQVVEVENVKMLVNYGIEKLRFNQAVTVGSEVRLRATLVSIANLRGIAKAEIKVALEIRDCPKTAMDATVIFLYHFK